MIKLVYRNEEGTVINIGEWDDKEGANPMPDNLTSKDEECIIGWDDGIYTADDPRATK